MLFAKKFFIICAIIYFKERANLMNLEPPQPPTAPAPAMRPTPPTPPRIDREPFIKDSGVRDKDSGDVYENMARDAVAHGSGALTKRTVDRGDKQNPPPNQTVTVIPPDAPLIEDTQSDYDKGQDVLREFREMDARESSSNYEPPAQTSIEQPRTPRINHDEGNGGFFWIFTIIFVAVATFFIAKNFLFTDKPALTKSQLFEDDKVKATPNKPTPPKPADKPARLANKKEDDKKGKHFEVRV
ncbi:MAG: hypothetical protein IKT98_08025 [Selenomonadaceae bacterium]|nr:hypothetical protein [Selenomonadaceae bacterium]